VVTVWLAYVFGSESSDASATVGPGAIAEPKRLTAALPPAGVALAALAGATPLPEAGEAGAPGEGGDATAAPSAATGSRPGLEATGPLSQPQAAHATKSVVA
jgi:hypothetical protein